MASDNAPVVSTEQRETFIEKPKDSLVDQRMVALMEVASE
jgi:hypothetical protein